MTGSQCEMKVNSEGTKNAPQGVEPRCKTNIHADLPKIAQGGVEMVHALLREGVEGGAG